MGSGTQNPDFFGTRTRLLLPEPINSDVVGKPKSLKLEENPTFLVAEPGKWYPNPTFATRTHQW